MADSGRLTGASLSLVPFSSEHLTARYVSWLNDPETVRFSEQRHRRHTLESCRSYAASFIDAADFFWAIVDHEAAVGHIGNITARVDRNNAVADLAILIGDPSQRGRGRGREAWTLALRYLLGAAGMRKVTAGTMAVNTPMLRLMRTTGMQEDGRRRGQLVFNGEPVDVVYAAAFRD